MAIIDLVRWAPEGNNNVLAYKFPESNLSTYTQLIVQESQEAILFSKGKLIGKFGPGKHTLNTENLPLLRNLFGIPFGGKNPFIAEIWFVNFVQTFNIDWTIDRMDIHDNDYNVGLPLVSNGKYGIKVKDSAQFLLKIVGTKSSFTQNDLTEQFTGEFTTKTKSTLMQFMMNNQIGYKKISAYLDNISEHLKTILVPFWENLGIDLTKFYVTTIEIDSSTEVGRKVLEAISSNSAQSIAGYTWQQEKAFGIANGAVNGAGLGGSGGLLGAVVATGMLGGIGGGSGMLTPNYNQPTFGANNNSQLNIPNPVPYKEIFCSNCSKKFANTNKFCPHCGDEYLACPQCGTDNAKNAKKCVSCSHSLTIGHSSTTCIKCNSSMEPGSLFCANCGQQSPEYKCSRCSTTISPSSKFCPKCGQKN
jgi:membrane protease subunit (stomatin/prohibitin family)